MSPNKRKIFESDTSDEEDSFKHRRSSLRVNLSRSDNQTDSGNGSLWRTEIENDEGAANAAQAVGRSSRGRGSTADERISRRSDPGHRDHTRAGASNTDNKRAASNDSGTSAQGSKVKEGVQLKRLTINLEDISTKERHLETSCERLKDAILSKTKQIFDGENELSVKTLKVLRGNKEKRLASGTRNPRRTESETIVLDTTDRPAEGGEQPCAAGAASDRRGADSNIVATPMSNDRRGSLERTVDKSRLTQRRLVFVERDKQVQDGQTRCRIIEDVALRRNSPPPKQADETSSPILSGSNRRLSLFGGRGRLRSQNQYLDNAYSTVHSVRTTSIGMPVVCSTFIDDNATTGERGTDCNDASASRATHTTTRVISMEMTEVQGGVRERHVSVRSRMSDASNSTEGESHEEGSMERNKDAVSPRQEDIEYPVSGATANEIPQVRDGRIKGQNKKSCTISLSDSDNTMRSSLKVNTSLDELIETSRAGNVRKPSDYRTNNANQDFATAINRKKSIDLNDQRESTNTARTSLQMNTSVDSMRETWRGRSDEDDKERSRSSMKDSSTTGNKETRNEDLDSLENISLIERLRNISVRNPVSHNDKSRFSKMRDEDKRRSSNSGDSYSYVEGTPYPISRLVLFRSQLKHKTQHLDDAATCSSGLNSMGNEESNDKTKSAASHSKVLNERHTSSTETQKTMEASTVTVEDTPNSNPFVTQNQLTVIKDTPEDGTRTETDEKNTDVQNTECAPVRKGRRRLLPLHETSQLCSLTPVEERRCTPEEPTSAKQNERPKKRPPKRKTVKNSKRNTNDIKHDTASKPTLSDSDCDMLENRKQEVKKTRRPKKVISKKILVKKFADENVLNLLQENRQDKRDHLTEDRDSLDDFVKCRTILSTQRNKHKSQKIVIVTTGLSKGDKSLVNSIVKSLGAAEVEMNVSRRTTHVVSTGVRTVNLLRGIIRGCWLVTLEWVLKSLENNAWLNPETFEMKHFSKAVQENRKDRQLFGLSYTPELFSACGFIHIEHKTTMPCDTLKELIKTAGGHITENIKLAKIIIGANGLKETWVVDSITTGELQLTKFYQRN